MWTVYPCDGMAGWELGFTATVQHQKRVLHHIITGSRGDQNSKSEVLFLLNMYKMLS